MRVLLSLALLLVPAIVQAAPTPVTVTLSGTAIVSDDPFTLGEIAVIKAPAAVSAKLAAAAIGRSPLDGVTRTVGRGDISLKLRQAGIDPAAVVFAGAETVTVSLQPVAADTSVTPAAASASATPAPVSAGQPTGPVPTTVPVPSAPVVRAPAVKPVTVKSGDPVTVMYIDGPVVISVEGTLVSGASVGMPVEVRTSFSYNTLKGTLVDAQTVRL